VTGEDGLAVISTGPLPPDPHELLASPRIGEVLAALAGTVDVVIVVAPPVLAAADAAVLAKQVDGTFVVATSGTTAASQLRRAVDALQGVGASLVGVVLHEPAQTKRSNDQPRVSLTPASRGDVVLVTSPGAKEGKSSASVNLAAALAEAGKSVVALDFDLRRPRLHQFFGEDPHRTGLTDVLALSGRGPSLEEVVRPTVVPEVRVALSGSAVTNPSELLPGARQLIAGARGLAQAILIDTPPVLVASDAVQLIPAADVVVIVCRTGRTRTTEAARARQLLARLDAPVAGLVLLGVQPSSGARSYYYDHTRRPFWSRSKSRRKESGPLRQNDATVPARAGVDETSVKAATGQGGKVPTKQGGSSKVTRDPHKALRGKAKKKAKQKQRS
jgi:capsular exopolysaccharide synthesis family protein